MAKILPASAAQVFLDALQTSQILNAETLAKVREQFAEAEDAKVVARDLIKDGKITKWQAQQLLGKFTALVVGNYKLLDQLGVGEMGRVYLAEHIQMQRKVALKVLARKHTSQPQILRRLLAEARRVAGIEHPNISHIQDVNQDGERYFIVLEYIDGEDLQHVVQRAGKLPAGKAWNFIRQAADGLAHAHSKGIVHGGLKPSNLLADQHGGLKILDFGLAQLAGFVEPNTNDSVDQAAITAKLFRAPEAEGQTATPQGDMYSLGASLFYLLTGNPPADGPASVEQLAKLAPETPSGLRNLCQQLMSASPADRPQNDQALLKAIEAANPGSAPAKAPVAKASPPPAKSATPPLKTAAALPTAKALPEDVVAKAAPPKAKKPVVAKAVPTMAEPETPVVAEAAASETPAEAASDTPFAGFAIQTKGRGKSAPAASSSGAMPALNAAAPPPPKGDAADRPAPAKSTKGSKSKNPDQVSAAKNNMPLILAGGIGGGVLVLGGIIALVLFLMNRGNDAPQIAKGEGENQATATEQKPAETATGETNPPVEANPIVAEANPVVPTVEANPMPVPPVVDPTVKPTVDPVKPEPMPMPMVTKPADPPMVAVVPPVEPKPEPKPMPKPMPKPVPVGDPFVGFAKSVALPKLPVGMSEPTPEMLASVVLGPCKVPDESLVISAILKGGATAYSKGKMTFSIEAGGGGTALRDWDIKIAGGLVEKPVVVATMSAKNDQLLFQWLPEAAKQAAAPYLCNCVIELSAGNGKTQFALRQPVSADPIAIGIDKRPPPAKFNIDLPPEPKQLMFEIVAVEGDVPKVKYDNKDLVAEKDTTFFWIGNVETEMPLGIKVDTSLQGGRTVQVVTLPQFKLEGMSRPQAYGKKELQNLKSTIDQEIAIGTQLIQQSSAAREAKTKQDLNQAGTLRLEPAQKASAQFEQLMALAKGLQTNGKVHFRIYANAEDGKVELINSGGAAPAPMPAVPAGGNNKKKL